MHRSIAVFLLAVSYVSAFPVVILSQGGGASGGSPRLFHCVSSIQGGSANRAFKCHPRHHTHSTLKATHNFPIFEIVEEPLNEVTALEVETMGSPVLPLFDTVFHTSRVVGSNANTKYEVIGSEKSNQGGCDDDEVFVGELNMCMPYSAEEAAPQAATLLEEVEEVEVEQPIPVDPSFQILKVGYAPTKCPPGEMHNPSIGICIPVNNCYPYPDCKTMEEEKKKEEEEKKKEEEEKKKQQGNATRRAQNQDDDDDDK